MNISDYSIEHLELDLVPVLFEVIFGFYNPSVVIVTTPNKDFNANFKTMRYLNQKGEGVRHPGHIFEWTHAEFRRQCEKYARMYRYSTTFDGVGFIPGATPDRMTAKDSCTQICIFTRDKPLPHALEASHPGARYKLLHHMNFPCRYSHKFTLEDIVDEVLYNAECLVILTYIDKWGSVDNVNLRDSYSEVITLDDIIYTDDQCMRVKYSSCMLVSSIKYKALRPERLELAIKSDYGRKYFVHNDGESFTIKMDIAAPPSSQIGG